MTLVVDAEEATDEVTDPTGVSVLDIEALFPEAEQHQRFRRVRLATLVAILLIGGGTAWGITAGGSSRAPRLRWAPSAAHSLPGPLASAVNKTLTVRSVEIVTNYQPGPAIYQEPDLYAAPEDIDLKSASDAFYVARRTMFWANEIGRLHTFPGPPLQKTDGLLPAQWFAFGELVTSLRSGTDFARVGADAYTFRTTTVNDAVVRQAALGEIWLSDGHVARLTVVVPRSEISWEPYGPEALGTRTTRYEGIDNARHLIAPNPDISMCRAMGSLILRRCSAEILP